MARRGAPQIGGNGHRIVIARSTGRAAAVQRDRKSVTAACEAQNHWCAFRKASVVWLFIALCKCYVQQEGIECAQTCSMR